MENVESTDKGWQRLLTPIRAAIFGKQNERLEIFMDNYFKLSPEARTATLVGGALLFVTTLLGAILLYLSAMDGLQRRLDDAFNAVGSIREVQDAYQSSKQKMSDLEQKLAQANQGLTLLSFLEQKSRDLGVTASNFPAQPTATELPGNNPLAKKYHIQKVEFNVSNVSLKKIVDLVIAIEAPPHMLSVSGLKIKSQFGNKLFFNATFEIEGYISKRQ